MCVIIESKQHLKIPRKESAKKKAIVKELLSLDYKVTQNDSWFVRLEKKISDEIEMQFCVNLMSPSFSVSIHRIIGGMVRGEVYGKTFALGELDDVLKYIENHELAIIWALHEEIEEREKIVQTIGNEKRRLERKKSQCSK